MGGNARCATLHLKEVEAYCRNLSLVPWPQLSATLRKSLQYIDRVQAKLLHRLTAFEDKYCRQSSRRNVFADSREIVGT